jgi:hypothetical protein
MSSISKMAEMGVKFNIVFPCSDKVAIIVLKWADRLYGKRNKVVLNKA